MEKKTAIEYVGWIGFCTSIFMRRYLRSEGFKFRSVDIEYLIRNLKEVYTANEFIQFVKEIKVKYNSDMNTIYIFVSYGDEEFSDKCDLEYNIDALKIEHEENYKPVNEMILEEDGRIRFTGEFQAITRFEAQRFDSIGMYDNKFESERDDIRVYFEGEMANGLPEGRGKLVWYDGSSLYEGEFRGGKVTGFGKSYFLDGNLSTEGYRVNGILNGEYIQYFENGQVESIGTMKEGLPIGYGVAYYEDGRVYYKGRHDDDGVCLDGLIYYLSENVGYKYKNDTVYIVDTNGNIKRKLNEKQFRVLKELYKHKKAC